MVAEVEFFLVLKLSRSFSIPSLCFFLQKKFEKTEYFDILNLVFEISNLKLLNSLKLDA